MSNSEERTRRRFSKLGRVLLIVGTTMTVAGALGAALFSAGRPGDGIWVSGACYALGGLVYRPSTWERLSIEYLPQQTPMGGHLLALAATGTLWHVTVRPLLFG